jgi:hypothetical protein
VHEGCLLCHLAGLATCHNPVPVPPGGGRFCGRLWVAPARHVGAPGNVRGAPPNLKLTFHLDRSVGADQPAGTEAAAGDALAKVAMPLLYCSIRDRIAPSGTPLWHQIEGVLVEYRHGPND